MSKRDPAAEILSVLCEGSLAKKTEKQIPPRSLRSRVGMTTGMTTGFDTAHPRHRLANMEVHFRPETESRLQELASKSGRPPSDLIEDAMAGYLLELPRSAKC